MRERPQLSFDGIRAASARLGQKWDGRKCSANQMQCGYLAWPEWCWEEPGNTQIPPGCPGQ